MKSHSQVAIVTKQPPLVLGVAALSKKLVKSITPTRDSFVSNVPRRVVNRQKFNIRFAATNTLATISGYYPKPFSTDASSVLVSNFSLRHFFSIKPPPYDASMGLKVVLSVNPPLFSYSFGGVRGTMPSVVIFGGFAMLGFVGFDMGLLDGRDAMLTIGTQPLDVHPLEVNKEPASRGVFLMANLLPRDFQKVIASLFVTADGKVGVNRLSDAAMTTTAPCAFALYGHSTTVEDLLVRFVVQEDGSEFELLLKTAQVTEHDAHLVAIFVKQVIVTQRVNDKHIRLFVADKFTQVVKGLLVAFGGVKQQGSVVAAYNFEAVSQRDFDASGFGKRFQTLVASLWADFVVKVENPTRTMDRKERLTFLTVFPAVSAEQGLLQGEAQANVECEDAFAGLGFASDEPSPAFGKESFADDAWNRKWCGFDEFVGCKEGHLCMSVNFPCSNTGTLDLTSAASSGVRGELKYPPRTLGFDGQPSTVRVDLKLDGRTSRIGCQGGFK